MCAQILALKLSLRHSISGVCSCLDELPADERARDATRPSPDDRRPSEERFLSADFLSEDVLQPSLDHVPSLLLSVAAIDVDERRIDADDSAHTSGIGDIRDR